MYHRSSSHRVALLCIYIAKPRQRSWHLEATINEKAFRGRLLETEWDARKWWVSEAKTSVLEFLWQTSQVKMVEESVKSMRSRTQKGFTLKACICVQGERGFEKSVIRYIDGSKQMLWNIFCALVGPSTLPARKILFSSIIITIILSYAIIRIYTILHSYLQVSKTEGSLSDRTECIY